MSVGFIVAAVIGFVGMDVFSYFAHRYLFHGLFWFLHKSHHEARKGTFERNDFFSVVFAAMTITLMLLSGPDWKTSWPFGLACGITAYGMAYFFVHDIFTHRRFIRFETKNKYLQRIRQAHRIHHQYVEKKGHEPFAFLWFKL